MKRKFAIIAALALAMPVFGQSPVYKTVTASGATAATAYLPSSGGLQARVVGVIATSDKAGSVITFTTGSTPATISATNASGTTITVARTNGLAAADVLVIEGVNGVTNATISSFTGATNITLASNTGFITLPGDQVYKMGTPVTLRIGAVTNASFQGSAIYVGNPGRPIKAVVDGTSAVTIDALSAHYE
jgi:hypothetical protein